MSQHDPIIRIRHMRAHAQEAIDLTTHMSPTAFRADRILQLATVRLLEVIGEAANRTPESVQAQHPQLPWRQMTGLRNRLIHGYDGVDLDIVWTILTTDLPPLVSALDAIIQAYDEDAS